MFGALFSLCFVLILFVYIGHLQLPVPRAHHRPGRHLRQADEEVRGGRGRGGEGGDAQRYCYYRMLREESPRSNGSLGFVMDLNILF